MLYDFPFRLLAFQLLCPPISPDDGLAEEAHGNRRGDVDGGVLLDEADRAADRDDDGDEHALPVARDLAVLEHHREDAEGIAHVQARADAGRRVEGVDDAHDPREEIVVLEGLGTEILPARIEHIDRHGDDLREDDEPLQALEALDVIERVIEERSAHEHIPEHIRDDEQLIERDHVVQHAVDRMAARRGDQILGDKIHQKVEDPAAQQLQVGKLRLVQLREPKPAVVHHRGFVEHGCILLSVRIFRPEPFGNVAVGHDRVLRERFCDARDLFLEVRRDPSALVVDLRRRVEGDRLADVDRLQRGGDIHRHELQRRAGASIIHPREIDEAILKLVDDVVIVLVLLREDDEVVPLLQALHGGAEGRDEPRVVPDRDRVRVIEDADRERRDDVREQFIKPVRPLGLLAPEIAEGVAVHVLPLEHLPGAPDVLPPREIELAHDRAVHLRVVADDDGRLLREILRADEFGFRIKQPHQPADDAIDQRCLFVLQRTQSFLLCYGDIILYHKR